MKSVLRKMETGLGVSNANFPLDGEGRTYHVGVKAGEVAARLVSVGDPARAELLAGLFDAPATVVSTNRGFTTHSGLFRGVPVSVVATGMGMAMMDFLLREVAAVTPGPLVVVRFGTCGTLDAGLPVGSVCLSTASVACRRNEDAWDEEEKSEEKSHEKPYLVSRRPVPSDPVLLGALKSRLAGAVERLDSGLNCTADTFYASQGRTGTDFDDRNADLIKAIVAQHPQVKTLEMETFQLFHLAACSREHRIRAGAVCIVLANRVSNDFLGAEAKHRLEKTAGKAILEAITEIEL